MDFVETHLDTIIREAVEAAECKDPSLAMMADGCGRAAIEGVTHALRQLTGLKVDARGATITLIWAETNPGLV